MNAKIDKLKLALADAKAAIQALKMDLHALKADNKETLTIAKGTVVTKVTKKPAKPAAKKVMAPKKSVKATSAVKPIKKIAKKVVKKKMTRTKKVEPTTEV